MAASDWAALIRAVGLAALGLTAGLLCLSLAVWQNQIRYTLLNLIAYIAASVNIGLSAGLLFVK